MTKSARCSVPVLFLAFLLFASAAAAATFTVTSLADSGAGSLRQAVLDANAAAGADDVAFAPGLTGTISLTSGEIAISDPLTVNGPGLEVLTLDANGLSRIFIVENTVAALPIDVTLSGMTITRGGRLGLSGMPLPYGGAVFSHGENLTIEDSVVSDSTVTSVGLPAQRNCGGNVALLGLGGANGGALRIVNSLLSGGRTESSGAGGNLCVELGTLHLERSTLSGGNCGLGFGGGGGLSLLMPENASSIVLSTITGNGGTYIGGGIYADLSPGGSLTIESSTISINSAGTFGNGGGLSILGGEVRIENSTVSENNAAAGGGIGSRVGNNLQIVNSTISGNFSYQSGGAIHFSGAEGGSLDLLHSTIFANRSLGGGAGVVALGPPADSVRIDHSILANNGEDLSVFDVPVTANYSLIQTPGITSLVGAHNLTGIDPQLGPLASNGGPTKTHKPLLGSPVISVGDPSIPDPPATDQRGFPRIVGPAIDLGAVEVERESVEVPTLSDLGLAALCLLILSVGVLRMRRGGAPVKGYGRGI